MKERKMSLTRLDESVNNLVAVTGARKEGRRGPSITNLADPDSNLVN